MGIMGRMGGVGGMGVVVYWCGWGYRCALSHFFIAGV